MTMDPQIIAAFIGGLATIAAVVIAWWLHEKKIHDKLTKLESKDVPLIINHIARQEADSSKHQPAKEPATSLSKITVKEIVESINNSPPFQKEQIAQQYNGIMVEWTGYLREAMEDPRDKESVRVNLTLNQDTLMGNSFWLTERILDFPEIRTLKRGGAVRVVGVILSASGGGLCVELKPIAIEVLEHHA